MALGVVAAILGGLLEWRIEKVLAWPRTDAEILSSELMRRVSGDGAAWRPRLVYRYRVAAHTYTAERVGLLNFAGNRSWAEPVVRRFPPGSTATIHYDPTDPAAAVLEPALERPLAYGLMGAGGVLGVLGLFLELRTRRRAAGTASAGALPGVVPGRPQTPPTGEGGG